MDSNKKTVTFEVSDPCITLSAVDLQHQVYLQEWSQGDSLEDTAIEERSLHDGQEITANTSGAHGEINLAFVGDEETEGKVVDQEVTPEGPQQNGWRKVWRYVFRNRSQMGNGVVRQKLTKFNVWLIVSPCRISIYFIFLFTHLVGRTALSFW